MEVLRLLYKLLPSIRKEFVSNGFGMPSLYLYEIERIRIRDENEKDYQFYLDALLWESFGLDKPWKISLRSFVNSEFRSEYLDFLQIYNSDLNSLVTLDRNFFEFTSPENPGRIERLNKFRNFKLLETERHLEISEVLTKSVSVLKAVSLEQVKRLAKISGFELVSNKLDGSITHMRFVPEVESRFNCLALNLILGREFKKTGEFAFSYEVDDDIVKSFTLASLIAGGNQYTLTNDGPVESLLNLHAHFEFGKAIVDCYCNEQISLQ